MENKSLTDPMVKPDNIVLEKALGKNYQRYKDFISLIETKSIVHEWHYYNDSKSWLCKVLRKKKNICWLSIWNSGFKLTFYFTEKTIGGVYGLNIDDAIKKKAQETKCTGRLIPLILLIKNKNVLNDGIILLEYKMGLQTPNHVKV